MKTMQQPVFRRWRWWLATLIAFLCIAYTCSRINQPKTVIVSNPSSFHLTNKPVIIRRSALSNEHGNQQRPVLYASDGEKIIPQTDDTDADNVWDELFFLSDFNPGEVKIYQLKWEQGGDTPSARVNAHLGKRLAAQLPVKPVLRDTFLPGNLPAILGYQPYQTDGPVWENDKVGFRHYLDGRNAKDLFGKQHADLVLDKVGLTSGGAVIDNYHVLAPWGRDVLSVGESPGLGGIALLIGDKPARLGVSVGDTVTPVEQTVLNITASGPLRTRVELDYKNWHASPERVYQVRELSSIWPGMYAFQNKVQLSGLIGGEQLLVSIPKTNTDRGLSEWMVNDDWVVLYTHDQQSYDREYWLGLALLLPKEFYRGNSTFESEEKLHDAFYAKLKLLENQYIEYYVVGCWEYADPQFKDESYFKNYLQRLADELDTEVRTEIR